MAMNILMFVLAAGIPYYLLLEKFTHLHSKTIFYISALMLVGAITMSYYVPNTHDIYLVEISFVSALFSIYKATKTTNFYKLGYYLIFVNAPFFILFEEKGAHYSSAMLVSLLGLYFIGRFYEKHYASANYHYIKGITLATPHIGTFLTVYLVTLALYPPFPNAIFFFSHVLQAETSVLWYVVIITLFFGNFILAMRVMKESLFGRPDPKIHYVDLTFKEQIPHLVVIILLLGLSIYGLKEIFA